MNKSKILQEKGQSIWLDNIDRELIDNGWFAEKINKRIIVGVTSNPSIFQKSIATGTAYSQDIQTMSWGGLDSKEVLERLVVQDIQTVADMLAPVYEESERKDGYVNLEVDPFLANDTEKTIEDAKRLWSLVGRENLMIKIPGTPEGIPAIRTLIAAGINVNITLLFSTQRYLEVIDAYYSGLEERLEKQLSIENIFSFASFFISRMDVMVEKLAVDKNLKGQALDEYRENVFGKIGIQNARDAYAAFEDSLNSVRFKELEKAGANIQRPLWASTGTKNSAFSDILYVEEMMLPNTVNTVPPATLKAWLDHGDVNLAEKSDYSATFEKSKLILTKIGIDIEKVFSDLEDEGVQKFKSAQASLNKTTKKECKRNKAQISFPANTVSKRLDLMDENDFCNRFYKPDVNLFTDNSEEEEEVFHRMGWIDAPIASKEIIPEIEQILKNALQEGFTHAVVLGMGGSSLAPEVFSEVFRDLHDDEHPGLDLSILDSTDPEQIQQKTDTVPLKKTLFIASSKSGTTVEMKSLVAYYMDRLKQAGVEHLGKHFMCITDPGTALEEFGKEKDFRAIINADPNVGGRYSALIAFGLVPAILAGIDGEKLLANAQAMRQKCSKCKPLRENPAFVLAAILAESTEKGMDKLTILADDRYVSVGSWLEQLVAESSGKNGKGLVPINDEPISEATNYSKDRIFYYLRDEGNYDDLAGSLQENGHTVLVSQLEHGYALAGEMYKWEVTIAAFCCFIGVNPFNQPNVQASKALAIKMLETFKTSSSGADNNVVFENDDLILFASPGVFDEKVGSDHLLDSFLKPAKNDYLAINAFLPRLSDYKGLLRELRTELVNKYSVPVTLGFGPRFLHSTGQLHKGGKNNGLFLMLTQKSGTNLDIPGEGISFSTLEKAQAMGDMQALEAHDRRVVRVHFKHPITQKVLDQLI